MYSFLIFAGTTEGRELVNYLEDKNVRLFVCVATEYGETLINQGKNTTVLSKRLDSNEMIDLIKENSFDLVIDTTHPYAVEVSNNIIAAVAKTNTKYLRLNRDNENIKNQEDLIFVNSVEEAVKLLKETQGNVLITTGSKELKKYTDIENYKERLYARVLSTPNVVLECNKLGFVGSHLFCMQGPFIEEFNYALLKQISAKYMVTKESGKAGGYLDKIKAARRANAKCIIIGPPSKLEGYSYNEVLDILEKEYKIKSKRTIYLVGIGMGNFNTMTLEAKSAFKMADLIIGAKRMVDGLKTFNKPCFLSYKMDEIAKYIENNKQYNTIAIALSGDTGFYSGAKRLIEGFNNYEINVICGISSVVYFAARLKTSWEDIKLLSMHGKEVNIINEVTYNRKVFSLLGGSETIHTLCLKLIEANLEDVKISIGINLSYSNEEILIGTPKDFINIDNKDLAVVIIENNRAKIKKAYINIKDTELIRGEVPMTKEEIRALSIIKLDLSNNSVVYDIGAGTGSIALEIALNIPMGRVYAVEKNPKGIELINKNKQKFNVNNLSIIEGLAPDILNDLEPPSHAFIGGSSGNLKEIIKMLLNKNPSIKIVVNAITIETLSEIMECTKIYNLTDVEITNVVIAKNKKLGGYNLMKGENPIYIISFKGGKIC